MGIKQKKIQNGLLKKTEIFKTANSQKIFPKFSWIGSWISSIDWCEEHWCGSTYMLVRLSDFTTQMILRIPPQNLYNKGIIFFQA